ncbi:MAG TPA: P1 family peptidase [Streptosporangiaceae bacterium]
MSHIRARDLGIPLDGTPGRWNALTDVPGVEVGYTTLVDAGAGVRTGVTAILPRGHAGVGTACAAGWHSMNGNGEMTGTTWISESGALDMPVAITNTHAVGTVHRGVIDWVVRAHPALAERWLLPVVAETWDGRLNDINGDHVRPAHAGAALDAAASGPVAEGSVGGGTGMVCYGFKGGSGTSSRTVPYGTSAYTVGAFAQANFGSRPELVIAGVPAGRELAPAPADGTAPGGAGSVIVVVGTDAPLLSGQCAALARRVPIGLARTGTSGSHFSGDIFLAFSTANPGALTAGFPEGAATDDDYETLRFVPWRRMDPFSAAVAEAVEESVLNALVAATDTTDLHGNPVPALPHTAVRDLLAARGVH